MSEQEKVFIVLSYIDKVGEESRMVGFIIGKGERVSAIIKSINHQKREIETVDGVFIF